jgi:hypothetical protein
MYCASPINQEYSCSLVQSLKGLVLCCLSPTLLPHFCCPCFTCRTYSLLLTPQPSLLLPLNTLNSLPTTDLLQPHANHCHNRILQVRAILQLSMYTLHRVQMKTRTSGHAGVFIRLPHTLNQQSSPRIILTPDLPPWVDLTNSFFRISPPLVPLCPLSLEIWDVIFVRLYCVTSVCPSLVLFFLNLTP